MISKSDNPYVFQVIFAFIADVIGRNFYIPIIYEIIEYQKHEGIKIEIYISFYITNVWFTIIKHKYSFYVQFLLKFYGVVYKNLKLMIDISD